MTAPKPTQTRNYLLNAFEPDTQARLSKHLEPFDAALGINLYMPYEKINYIYFPNSSIASIVANTEDGRSTEIGVVGCEGAVGLEVLMGSSSSPHESMIQIANGAHRILPQMLLEEFNRSESTRKILLGFVNKLMIQISRTTLCNRLHSVEQRLARWLLMCDDRIEGDHLYLTQEFLAVMLGVARTSVTLAAIELQSTKSIHYKRADITVLDRKELENAACECYQIVKDEYDRTECD
jgi:cAMP-binding proteins - catabolite gene activator and regulatory subunit of cAMP-dependent protein kinases